MSPSNSSNLSKYDAIFHFHDYGRKSKAPFLLDIHICQDKKRQTFLLAGIPIQQNTHKTTSKIYQQLTWNIMEPENTPLEKEEHLPTTNFWDPCWFSGVYLPATNHWLRVWEKHP